MIQQHKHLRDFVNEEVKAFMPGNMTVESCILLIENKPSINAGRVSRVIQVFNHHGTWIGEISHPDYFPLVAGEKQ